MSTPSYFGDEIPLEAHRIEVRIRKLRQMFDSLDPSPFIALDLDDDAQQYVVGSAKVLPAHLPLALVIHLREPVESPADVQDAGEAIREHFIRQSGFTTLRLKELIHAGVISLAIGLAFLSATLIASAALQKWAEARTMAAIFREGLIICGWVAMWRPIQIFLYDWWPILGDRRLFDRLSRMPVQIVYANNSGQVPPAPETS